MIKISRNDPFDIDLCIRGLGVMLTYMHSDLYEYTYYFTFKRSMKSYAKDFTNAWDQSIDHDSFFTGSEDLFVQNAHSSQNLLIEGKLKLILRFGLDELSDLENEEILMQSFRFRPYFLLYKSSKSYKKLTLFYERSLTEFIECLYFYACALTAQSNKVPLVLKKQFNLPESESLRLLNGDDNTVELLKDLITDLKKNLAGLKVLLKK